MRIVVIWEGVGGKKQQKENIKVVRDGEV